MEILGIEAVCIAYMSGKPANNPESQKMIAFTRDSDTIIVKSIIHKSVDSGGTTANGEAERHKRYFFSYNIDRTERGFYLCQLFR